MYLCEASPQAAYRDAIVQIDKWFAGCVPVLFYVPRCIQANSLVWRCVFGQQIFTKRYAQWTAEAVKADCFELSEAREKDLSGYEAVVFGSWVCAGSLSKFGWFKSNMDKWKDKKLAVFCVGASPADNPEVQDFLKQNFGGPEFAGVRVFYCPGGFCYEKMGMKSKLMMKVFMKALKAKKEKTEAEKEMVRWISSSYDISDRKYIEPVLEYLKEL